LLLLVMWKLLLLAIMAFASMLSSGRWQKLQFKTGQMKPNGCPRLTLSLFLSLC
jgi:hypothetical protein